MGATSIQWTDHSVNPIRLGRGHFCQKISPGCANCYASRFQPRVGNEPFGGASGPNPPVGKDIGGIWLDDTKLAEVLRRRIPTKWFWCDMTDMFGHWVPDEFILTCFNVMRRTPHHTHQVLTKRPERMADFCSRLRFDGQANNGRGRIWLAANAADGEGGYRLMGGGGCTGMPWVWVGTSVEDQQRADERIPHLLRTPAAVRFLSCEPLLGPVDLQRACMLACPNRGKGCLPGDKPCERLIVQSDEGGILQECYCSRMNGLHWAIVGGESGHNARPMDVAWVRSIIGQCKAASVPVFVKQLGAKPFGTKCGDCDPCGAGQPCPYSGPDYHLMLDDRKGGDMAEWPSDLRVREFPSVEVSKS